MKKINIPWNYQIVAIGNDDVANGLELTKVVDVNPIMLYEEKVAILPKILRRNELFR